MSLRRRRVRIAQRGDGGVIGPARGDILKRLRVHCAFGDDGEGDEIRAVARVRLRRVRHIHDVVVCDVENSDLVRGEALGLAVRPAGFLPEALLQVVERRIRRCLRRRARRCGAVRIGVRVGVVRIVLLYRRRPLRAHQIPGADQVLIAAAKLEVPGRTLVAHPARVVGVIQLHDVRGELLGFEYVVHHAPPGYARLAGHAHLEPVVHAAHVVHRARVLRARAEVIVRIRREQRVGVVPHS